MLGLDRFQLILESLQICAAVLKRFAFRWIGGHMKSNHQCSDRLLDGIGQFGQALDLRLILRDLLRICLGLWLTWRQEGGDELADIGWRGIRPALLIVSSNGIVDSK